MNMNVLKDFPYRPRYYLTHPWKFVRECFINLKNAWMRITRGWCYTDLWNMNDYLTDVMIDMFRMLALKHDGYPGKEPFKTDTEWTSWLYYIAGELEATKEEFYQNKNEFKNEYYKELDNWTSEFEEDENGNLIHKANEQSEISKKYFAREIELYNEATQRRNAALQQVLLYYDYLWD